MQLNKCIYKYLLGVIVLFLSSTSTAQDIMFGPSLLYYTWDETFEGSSDSELTATYMDFKLGAKVTTNVYVGGIYSTMTRESNGNERKRTGLGPSVGLMSGGLFLIAHYLLNVEYVRSNSDTLEEGSGLQVDFGYLSSIGSNVYVGPQLTWRSFSYKKHNQGGSTSTLSDTKHTETVPYLALAFMF